MPRGHGAPAAAPSKRGAWGEGELAAAGTIMLGERAAAAPLHAAPPAAASAEDSADDSEDGVFEGPSPAAAWAPAPEFGAPPPRDTATAHAQGPPADDVFVEDVEDDFGGDEVGVAARGAVVGGPSIEPIDLAAKLAAFERALEEE
ncbi:hypothetical protein Rsub_08591 [Raphidocelis subcapitata]|uniref:Uncharacterized protein n=1 Tax=Raphidocelis subcapitata TaxID=307507 RepID=A0A2V0P7R7_9CHLO|nr:hypothetical protein Rsub_08591 [Raphidocelis subcapitata]|eukprot:GBF95609.1 hypothetical protein Rsub_08591 [Raphidocelis subcapitata]